MRQSLYRWDLTSDAMFWGATAAELLGASIPATARAFDDLLAPQSARRRRDVIRHSDCVDEGAGVAYQIQCELKDGRHIEEVGRWFAGPDGRPLYAQGLMRIASADYATPKLRLMRPRFHKHTCVLERETLLTQLHDIVAPQNGLKRRCALLLIEIENLAVLDRNYDETIIDEVLGAVAAQIRGQMRMGDILGLYAKGTFALALRGGDYDQMLVRAHQLLRLARETMFETSFGDVPVNFRIGGSMTKDCIDTLQHEAEAALAIARASRTKRFIPYGDMLTRHYNEIVEQTKAAAIAHALQNHHLHLFLQPIAESGAGTANFRLASIGRTGMHGRLPMPPLPQIDRDTWLRALDQRLLDLAVDHLGRHPAMHLCVPLNGATLRHRGFVANLVELVARYPDVAARLMIAIDEFALASNTAGLRRVITGLKHLGLKCALMHFGAAFAAPERLMQLAPDLIVIDAAFAQTIGRDADARFVLRSLIQEIAALGFVPAVAGIDNDDAAQLVRAWGAAYQIGTWMGVSELAEPPEYIPAAAVA
ncbi:EAL domain-containing protein [Methylovirgula sp. 4M-Z18]|uniref:EAL domain-containing protein n=1 Tax=Methylovirgula sp. 4M-Z18 TaxID=2293567 RepID=UPI0013149AAC|nr:EAL domain-containing protein [Methylovirgula sp. 4M-Z18]